MGLRIEWWTHNILVELVMRWSLGPRMTSPRLPATPILADQLYNPDNDLRELQSIAPVLRRSQQPARGKDRFTQPVDPAYRTE